MTLRLRLAQTCSLLVPALATHNAALLFGKPLSHISTTPLTNRSQSPESINHLNDVARRSIRGNPDESTAYGLTTKFTEMLIEHRAPLDVDLS
jgi:hypothetical protein